RDGELAGLASFLEADGPGRTLVIEGEAGIAKTTLWRPAVASSEAAVGVLRSAVEIFASSNLPFERAHAPLFVTVKTVEPSLTRVYEKLELRSRTELAAHSPGRVS
ncbi:MAG TPA: hypothetical protein VML35_02540, partial [Gaiellaceae bacterium]|nr:hypothetical protein [Gaiellaceae bacterium]